MALMSKADVVRRRCRLRPAAALGWSPCTVCTPAGQFHSMSCSADSYARSLHAVLTESPYKRHSCGLAVHAVRRVLGLLPGLCEKILRNERAACTSSSLNRLQHCKYHVPHSTLNLAPHSNINLRNINIHGLPHLWRAR